MPPRTRPGLQFPVPHRAGSGPGGAPGRKTLPPSGRGSAVPALDPESRTRLVAGAAVVGVVAFVAAVAHLLAPPGTAWWIVLVAVAAVATTLLDGALG